MSAGAFVGDMGLPSQSLCVPFLPIGGRLSDEELERATAALRTNDGCSSRRERETD